MSKLIYTTMISLDGFISTPDGGLDWVVIDEEVHTYVNEQVRAGGAMIYGRRMYELMADYWPTADADPAAPGFVADFSRIWKAIPKIVFSNTLQSVDWNSRLVKGNAVQEMELLKAQPGKDLMLGGADLAAMFMRRGMIDEYRLYVSPVALGRGVPAFSGVDRTLTLRLVETLAFRSGVVYLKYYPAAD